MEWPERPLPPVDADSAPYWDAANEGRLSIPVCRSCEQWFFYPRALCPNCGSTDIEWRNATGKGTVFSHTTVYQAPSEAFADAAPYVVGLVDLDEGPRMYAGIRTEGQEVRIGSRVEVTFERVADDIALPYFVVSEVP